MERTYFNLNQIAFRICLVLLVCMISAHLVYADSDAQKYKDEDGITWEYRIIPPGKLSHAPDVGTDCVEILGCSAVPKDGVLRIPSSIDGITVMSIGEKAFEESPGSRMIEEVILPESILIIKPDAFNGCSSLKHVNLPEGLRYIHYEAFGSCALEEVTLPDSLEHLGIRAFGWGSKLNAATIPKNFVFEEAVNEVFYSCSRFQEFRLKDGDTRYSVKDGVLYSNDGKELIAYPQGKYDSEFTVPEEVERIGKAAFEHASLREVTLPEGLRSIGKSAFAICYNLRAIRIPGGVQEIPEFCFDQCQRLEQVELSEGLLKIGDYSFEGCLVLNHVEIPKSVQEIGVLAFSNDYALTQITIPEGVTEIKESLFANAMSLEYVCLPDSLVSIGPTAFMGHYTEYSPMQHLYIPEHVQSIDDSAFQNHNPYLTIYSISPVAESYAEEHEIDFVHADRDTYEQLVDPGSAGKPCDPHNLVHHDPYPATCTSAGQLDYYYCTRCGKKFSDPEGTEEISATIIEKIPHTLVHTPMKAATETEEGNLEYWTCTVCGRIFFDPEGKNQTDAQSLIIPKETGSGGDGPDEPGGPDGPDEPPVTIVTPEKQEITGKDRYTKAIGTAFSLDAQAKTRLVYESSDEAVAKVDGKGVVTVNGYGTCEITITAEASEAFETASKTVVIKGILAKPKLKAVAKKKKVRLTWSKVAGADGYELYMKLQEEKRFRKVLTKPAKVKGVTHRGLTKGKKYSYKVRAYKKVGRKIVRSKYSKAVTVVIK